MFLINFNLDKLKLQHYSYLKASTGFNFEADLDGKYPEAHPIKNEKVIPNNISPGPTSALK